MSPARTPSRPRSILRSTLVIALAAVSLAASAAPALASTTAGISSKTADLLKQETGYSPAQLENEAACPAPKPGTMSCDAQILAVRSTGRAAQVDAPAAKPLTATRIRRSDSVFTPATSSVAAQPVAGSPEYLQWAYDLGALSASGGVGDTVAIVDAYSDPDAASDLATFRSHFGLPACPVGTCFDIYNQTGTKIDSTGTPSSAPPVQPSGGGGWAAEESLDLDSVSALCPNCHIVLVEASSSSDSNLLAALSIADSKGTANASATQISMSFGGGETPGTDTTNGATNGTPNTWWYGNVASLAASGDAGYLGSNSVSYPAAHTDVTAIGGTSLNAASNARGFTETVWNNNKGATNSGCDTSVHPAPAYQSAITSSDGCNGRAYNDISADADPDTGLDVYDSYGGSGGFDGFDAVGGTSLATPLTAAYEAVTGIDSSGGLARQDDDSSNLTLWPQWTYAVGADLGANTELNDVTSGNDLQSGLCPTGEPNICTATTGWDGPTGNGSIDGDIVTGAPQIGGTYAGGTTLSGGIYPNGTTTSYTWEYATSAAYSANDSYSATYPASGVTAPTVNGQTLQTVSSTIPALMIRTTYDYRLDITYTIGANSYTIDGYNNSFVAGSPAPAGSAGTNSGGSSGTGTTGTTTTGTTTGTGTTSSAPPSSNSGSNDSTNTATTDNTTPPQPTEIAAPTATSLPVVGGEISLSGGSFANAESEVVQFYRCAHTCTLLGTGGATRYRLRAADAGHFIKLQLTVTGAPGTSPLVATDWIGVIRAPNAGAATLSPKTRVGSAGIYGTTNQTLASVRVTRHSGKTLSLAITKPKSARTQFLAFVIAGGSVVSCTEARALNGTLRVNATLLSGQTLKLVAVRG